MSFSSSADELLTLRGRRRRDTSRDIASVTAQLFLREGTAEPTVADIAAAAGISTRTFHRYFPTKAEALTPILREGMHAYLQAVRAIPATPHTLDDLAAALIDALVDQFTGELGRYRADLVRLIVTTPELLSVWLRINEECALSLLPLLAARLPGEYDLVSLRLVSTLVVTANRLAVESWAAGGADVRTHLEHCRDLLRGLQTGR